ncbi:g5430 [Coccomyxa elongata]
MALTFGWICPLYCQAVLTSLPIGLLVLALSLQASRVTGTCDFSRVIDPVHVSGNVRWLPDQQECEPDVCNGLHLGDVPDASGHMPLALFCSLNLHDTALALTHLKGKYIVMFGDSTMEENMYDLVLLISGISTDVKAMDVFLDTAIRQDRNVPREFKLPVQGESADIMTGILMFTKTTWEYLHSLMQDLRRSFAAWWKDLAQVVPQEDLIF